MGWTFISKHTGRKEIESFLKNEFKGNHEVLECAVRNNEAYLAVKNLTTGEVGGWVVLLSLKKNQTGYKDLHESEGPMYFKCPKKIIKKLSSTNDVRSIAWRAACVKKIQGDVYGAARRVLA